MLSTLNTGLHRLRARLGRFDGQHQLDERDRRVGRTRGLLAGLGLAWSFGTWTGLWLEFTPVSIWLAIFGGLAVASLVIRKNRFQTRLLLVLATTTLAGSRASLHVNSVSRSIIPAMRIADGRIISVEGDVSGVDDDTVRSSGLLERFGRSDASIRFMLEDPVLQSQGAEKIRLETTIPVFVRLPEDAALPMAEGERIRFRGRIHRSREPTSPGSGAREAPGIWIDVPDMQLIRSIELNSGHWLTEPLEIARSWRLAAHDSLESSLKPFTDARSRELVMAIVLGARQENFNSLSLPYRRTGLAHYLAVSGFAFGVLVAMPGLIATKRHSLLRTLIVLLVIAFGLLAIDIRSPALRAGMIAAASAIGLGLKRDWSRTGLLGLTCIILLAIDPREVMNPGFQLSFGVVAALLVLTPVLQRRFETGGDEDLIGIMRTWLVRAGTCGLVAWAAATPIVVHHFGIVSTVGVVMSVLAAPIVAGIVIMAVLAIASGFISTFLSELPGGLSAAMAWILDRSTCLVSEIPGCCFVMPMTNVTWMICSEIVVWRWFLHRTRSERWVLAVMSIILLVVAFIPETGRPEQGSVMVQTLDVGDGTCHVVTGPGGTVLTDAGSSSAVSCASRIILPALRDKGIKSIDGIVITHANLDHYSAAGDLFGRLPIRRILLGRSFLVRAAEEPNGAAAELIRLADDWSIPILVMSFGDEIRMGGMVWRFLHPGEENRWRRENDRSLVFRVEHVEAEPGSPAEILFTGDIEEAAMRHLMEEFPLSLRAHVLEIPHHGSLRPATGRFIECVKPDLILQSTGPRRMVKDELRSVIGGRMRACTAECGSITVISHNGQITNLSGFTRDPTSTGDVVDASKAPFQPSTFHFRNRNSP